MVDAAWGESGGSRNYLGEWHSHPEDVPAPSDIDIENWHRIIAQTVCEQDFLLFAIVGRTATQMWELSRTNGMGVLALEARESAL
jgi:integrative and conjugative element protein (TIGR02256 family)